MISLQSFCMVKKTSCRGSFYFNTFIIDLIEGIENIKFANYIKLGGTLQKTAEAFRQIFVEWNTEMNKMKFSKDKHKVLHRGKKKSMLRYYMGGRFHTHTISQLK